MPAGLAARLRSGGLCMPKSAAPRQFRPARHLRESNSVTVTPWESSAEIASDQSGSVGELLQAVIIAASIGHAGASIRAGVALACVDVIIGHREDAPQRQVGAPGLHALRGLALAVHVSGDG